MNKKPIIIFVIIFVFLATGFISFYFYKEKNSQLFQISEKIIDFSEESKQDNYKISYKYPEFSGIKNEAAQNKINESIKNSAYFYADKFKSDAKINCDFSGLGEYAPSWMCEFDVAFNDYKITANEILSVQMEYYQFTGGAHGNTNYVITNYDIKTGEKIDWRQIFLMNSDFFQKISELSFKNLKEKLTTGETPLSNDEWIKEGTAPNEENYNTNVGFTENGLLIIFQQYQVAPYAAGPQEVIIPYQNIENFLNLSVLLQ